MNLQNREISFLTGFTINVPEWFEDKDFKAWLNDPDNTVFTWHTKERHPLTGLMWWCALIRA